MLIDLYMTDETSIERSVFLLSVFMKSCNIQRDSDFTNLFNFDNKALSAIK